MAPLRLSRLSCRCRCLGVSSVPRAPCRRPCSSSSASSSSASASSSSSSSAAPSRRRRRRSSPLSGALHKGQNAGSCGPPSSAAWQERHVACPQGKTTASEGETSASRQTGHSSSGAEEREEDAAAAPDGGGGGRSPRKALSGLPCPPEGGGAFSFAAASALASASDFTGRGTRATERGGPPRREEGPLLLLLSSPELAPPPAPPK